jgi:hypothetical protein
VMTQSRFEERPLSSSNWVRRDHLFALEDAFRVVSEEQVGGLSPGEVLDALGQCGERAVGPGMMTIARCQMVRAASE